MKRSAKPLILPNGEACALEPGETVTLRLLGPRRPQSSRSPEEQSVAVLRAKAQFLREEAEALEAEAEALAKT